MQADLSAPGGQWHGHLQLKDFGALPRHYLGILFELHCAGLIYDPTCGPTPASHFSGVLAIPPRFPKAVPTIKMDSPAPYCAHVCQPMLDSRVDSLPPGLVSQIREHGEGYACFIEHREFDSSPQGTTLAVCLHQLSRIITLRAFHGEAATLCRPALDHTKNLDKQGRLPLGESLPYPLVHYDQSHTDTVQHNDGDLYEIVEEVESE